MTLVQKKKKAIILSTIIGILSCLCLFADIFVPAITNLFKDEFHIVSSNSNMLVHFISVGQADAMAINLPDGKTMIIDTGTVDSSSTLVKYIDSFVVNGKRNKKIDYLVLTHGDADHIGGSLRVLKEYDIGQIFLPSIDKDTDTYIELINKIDKGKYKTEINTDGYTISNEYDIEFLGPLGYDDVNDDCPVIKLTYMNKSFLFTADISSRVEEELIYKYGDSLDIDVLKVAHHGSKYSTCVEFLDTTTPEYSVISCGEGYGHPTDVVLDNLDNVGSKVLRTDVDGNILFLVGDNYDLSYVTGEFTITPLSLDYRDLICVLVAILMVNIVIVFLKKDKKITNKTK